MFEGKYTDRKDDGIMTKRGMRIPYVGILLFIIGIAWLLRSLNLLDADFFLPGIGLIFLIFYILSGYKQSYLIPGLIILAISGTSLLPRYVSLPPFLEHTLFFYLLGTAFLLLYVIHTRARGEKKARNWPLLPALILYFLGLFTYLLDKDVLPTEYLDRVDLLWPLALIITSLYIIAAHLSKRNR